MRKFKGSGVFIISLIVLVIAWSTAFGFNKIKFAVIADTHMDLYGVNEMKMGAASCEIVRKTVEELNTIPDLDFVLVVGDLLLDGEPYNLDLFKTYIDNLRVPYYVVMGNHDWAPAAKTRKESYVGVSRATFIWTFQGHGYNGPNAWWSAEVAPGVKVIGLDACVPGRWGGVMPEAELRWLDRELGASTGDFVIICIHHNFIRWSKDEEPGGKFAQFCVDNEEEVRKIIEKHFPTAQIVISGHRHIGLRYKTIKGIHYFVCPAAVSYPNQYTIFEVTPEKVTAKAHWVPISKAIIDTARMNLIGKPGEWWRPSDCPKTPEGDKKMLEFFEGPYLTKPISLPLVPVVEKLYK